MFVCVGIPWAYQSWIIFDSESQFLVYLFNNPPIHPQIILYLNVSVEVQILQDFG